MMLEMSLEAGKARIIAVANQKGGVGKTTTTINLAASMADEGWRVLIVDLDPQANATTGLGVSTRDLDHSIYDVLLQHTTAAEARCGTATPNLDLLPSSLALAGAEIELVTAFSREHRLERALAGIVDDYDIVLIDCPPALGLLTINALVVAGEVLVPIQCEYYALEGLGQLIGNVDLVKANLNPDLEVSTIALVMYDARTKLSEQVAAEVRSFFGAKVCRQVIPRSVRLAEAPSFGQPINIYDPTSRGAVAYRELAREVLRGSVDSRLAECMEEIDKEHVDHDAIGRPEEV
jgi:chromosome partitioning protein